MGVNFNPAAGQVGFNPNTAAMYAPETGAGAAQFSDLSGLFAQPQDAYSSQGASAAPTQGNPFTQM